MFVYLSIINTPGSNKLLKIKQLLIMIIKPYDDNINTNKA